MRSPTSIADVRRSLEFLSRAGLVARGAVYALVGLLAVGIASGERGNDAGAQGAIRTVADQSFGSVLLALLALGFVGYALWRLAMAIIGDDTRQGLERSLTRVGDVFTTIFYGGLTVVAVRLALGGSDSGGGGNEEARGTAIVLDWPFGRWIVVGAALVVAGVGIYWAQLAFTQEFRPPIDASKLAGSARSRVQRLGSIGYAARALTAALIALFLLRAAITFDPDEAVGLDGALGRLADTTHGAPILFLVAACLVLFGVFSWCQARWADLHLD